MLSPIGRTAQYFAAVLRTPFSKLASVNKKLAWTIVNNVVLSDSDVLSMILELLYFKQDIGDLTWFSKEEIDFIVALTSFFSPPFYHFIILSSYIVVISSVYV